jgi:hypothetical protein
MRRKILHKAKLVITVESDRCSGRINTISVFDNRTADYWSDEQIKERGISQFLSVSDMKETLNWNLNGNGSLYQFKWGQSSKNFSAGVAYVFQ